MTKSLHIHIIRQSIPTVDLIKIHFLSVGDGFRGENRISFCAVIIFVVFNSHLFQ